MSQRGRASTKVPKAVQYRLRLLLEPQNVLAAKIVMRRCQVGHSSARTTLARWAGLKATRTGKRGVIKGIDRLMLLTSVLNDVVLLTSDGKVAGPNQPVKKVETPSVEVEHDLPVARVNGNGRLKIKAPKRAKLKRALNKQEDNVLVAEIASLSAKISALQTATVRYESLLKSLLKNQGRKIDSLLEALQ